MAVNRKPHLSYERTTKFNFDIAGLTGIALYGKTAGIIGTGKIGQCMINILKGFGMDIVAYDAFPNPNLGLEYVTLDELYLHPLPSDARNKTHDRQGCYR